MRISARKRLVQGSFFALLLLGGSFNSVLACRSYAEKIEDAQEFCQMKLKCKEPLVLACYGQAREWKCRCEKPKEGAAKKVEPKKEVDYSINKNRDKASPKLQED